jgi:hypothetical protein
MSKLENSGNLPDDHAVGESSGVNLKLVYSLIALALLAALAVAALIVFPFYLRR